MCVYIYLLEYVDRRKPTTYSVYINVCMCVFVFLEVINKETMQNDYFHHHLPAHTTSIDHSQSDDEDFSFSNPTTNIDAEKVEEKERHTDEKHFEMGDGDDDKPLAQVAMTDDSSTFSFYDEFPYRESQQQQQQPTHTNSHDSLLQPDHHIIDTINTTASSTDDLSTTHQLSSSVFHSKDSALGLSDDNLNFPQRNPFLIMDDDDDDDDQQKQQQEILSSSSLLLIESKYLIA